MCWMGIWPPWTPGSCPLWSSNGQMKSSKSFHAASSASDRQLDRERHPLHTSLNTFKETGGWETSTFKLGICYMSNSWQLAVLILCHVKFLRKYFDKLFLCFYSYMVPFSPICIVHICTADIQILETSPDKKLKMHKFKCCHPQKSGLLSWVSSYRRFLA